MELDKQKLREKAFQYRYAFPVIAVFLLAVGLRYYPIRNIQYLQALDPYNLFRMSQQIAYEGSRPALDFMRWFPYPTPSYVTHVGNIAIPAIIYKLGGFMFFDKYLDYAYFVAPTFAGLASVGMYFLGKELYDKYAGLAAAFFLAVIPGVLYRSSAGFFEKEAIGTMFMISVSMLYLAAQHTDEDILEQGIVSTLIYLAWYVLFIGFMWLVVFIEMILDIEAKW